MELSSSKIKNFLIISKKEDFLIFLEMELSSPEKLNKTFFILLIKLFYTHAFLITFLY